MLLKKQGVERLVEDLKRRGQVPLLHEEGLEIHPFNEASASTSGQQG